jgi:hypothetical protein
MSRAYPTGEDVAAFLSRSTDSAFVDYCDIVVQLVRASAESYTRGRGFEEDSSIPNDLYRVVLTCTARMAVNPLAYQNESVDMASSSDRAAGDFNRGELRILNRYRRKFL